MGKSSRKIDPKAILKSPRFKLFLQLIVLIALVSGVVYGGSLLQTWRYMAKAEEALQKGLGGLAADYVEEYRHGMLRQTEVK